MKEIGRPPSRWFYRFVYLLTRPAIQLLLRASIRRDPAIRRLRGPIIVVGQHPSYFDPFLAAYAVHPLVPNFLASNFFFRRRLVGAMLHKLGAIPKIQFRANPQALKAMLRVLRRGGILGIFPEGSRSVDGRNLPIGNSIAKLVKKTGAAVVVVRTQGAHMSWPRWSKNGIRRGRVRVESSVLLTAEDVAAMTDAEIFRRMQAALAYNEYDAQREHPVRFRKKAMAAGLETILHKCPACRADWALRSAGDRIACRYCGNAARMTPEGFLVPAAPDSQVLPDPAAWNAFQRESMAEAIRQDGFSMEQPVQVHISDLENPYRPAGQGLLRLTPDGVSFEGTVDGAPSSLRFPLPGILGISADYGSNFELVTAGNETYRFYLAEGQQVIGFALAISLLREQAGLLDTSAL